MGSRERYLVRIKKDYLNLKVFKDLSEITRSSLDNIHSKIWLMLIKNFHAESTITRYWFQWSLSQRIVDNIVFRILWPKQQIFLDFFFHQRKLEVTGIRPLHVFKQKANITFLVESNYFKCFWFLIPQDNLFFLFGARW